MVVGVACSESYVYSGGEDKCVMVWDRRQRRVLQTVRVCSLFQLDMTVSVKFARVCKRGIVQFKGGGARLVTTRAITAFQGGRTSFSGRLAPLKETLLSVYPD